MISDWLRIPYRPYGRGPDGCDCWGLVRIVRKALRGDALPSYSGVDPDDKPALTAAARDVIAAGWCEVAPRVGAIASVWRGELCLHVGIVIEAEKRLAVLETNRATGPRWQRIHDFEARHLRVSYHDRDLPV